MSAVSGQDPGSVKGGVALLCPICDARMAVSRETTLSEFGDLDIKLHQLTCEQCGMTVARAFHPSVGYKTIAR